MEKTIKIINIGGTDCYRTEIVSESVADTKQFETALWEINREYVKCIGQCREVLSYTPIHNPENPYMKEIISKSLKTFLHKTEDEGFLISDYINTFARDLNVSEYYILSLLQT